MSGRNKAVRVVVRGTAAHVPERVVKSAELAAIWGLSEQEIVRRTGIAARRWAGDDVASSTLGIAAGKKVLAETGTRPESIDLVLVSTTSPDMAFPSTACLVQEGLGIGPAAAMDVFASCSGFLAALSMARAAILGGTARRVLIVAADVKSRFLDMDDPSTAMLFGDGAGAAIIEGVGGPESVGVGGPESVGVGGPESVGPELIGPVILHTDGSRWQWVHLPAGGSRMPMSADTLKAGLHTLKMDGIPLFKMAVSRFSEVVRKVLATGGLEISDVACFVFHQANLRILEAVGKRLKIAPDRIVTTLAEYGNTSSASLPITLDRAWRERDLRPGDHVVLATFGGGITWGACRLVWGGVDQEAGSGEPAAEPGNVSG